MEPQKTLNSQDIPKKKNKLKASHFLISNYGTKQ